MTKKKWFLFVWPLKLHIDLWTSENEPFTIFGRYEGFASIIRTMTVHTMNYWMSACNLCRSDVGRFNFKVTATTRTKRKNNFNNNKNTTNETIACLLHREKRRRRRSIPPISQFTNYSVKGWNENKLNETTSELVAQRVLPFATYK